MNDFEEKGSRVGKIEAYVSTAAFGLGCLILLNDFAEETSLRTIMTGESLLRISSYYFPEYFRYATVYTTFIVLNFYVTPRLIRTEAIAVNSLLVLGCLLMIAVAFARLDIALAMLAIFGCYYALKYLALYLWCNAESLRAKYRFLAPGALITGTLWLLSLLLLFIGEAEWTAVIAWSTIIPFGIFLYSYSFYSLIPSALVKKRPFLAYVLRMLLVLALSAVPLWLLLMVVAGQDEDVAPVVVTANALLQLVITLPFSWILYKRFTRGDEELSTLKKELGQSAANIDFLRSQINPHFLFNALNTLYGLALQENAGRTSEGIQKLGDMMRFMLQENMEDKISLAREIEYLNNYIALQRLRTDALPTVDIDASIDVPVDLYQISPMLLIPFVENAFKHGISFREPSNIKVALELKDGVLYFDIENSRHVKSENDPEKNYGGVGLANVKQRLLLSYPGKHELIVHETAKKFFIHLTIRLN